MKGIGIIGCGKISQVRHIPEYAANPEARIVGFFDMNLERAAQLAKQYDAKSYSTLEELLADGEIEAVSVCVANHAHASVTLAALRAGKDVLCEKPMAISMEECEEMVRVADECGRILMIGQNQRLAKAHVVARKLIQDGWIGRPLTFRTCFGHSGPETWSVDPGKNSWFFNKNMAAMGVMADLGIHKTDLIQHLLDTRVTSVCAQITTLDKTDPEGNPISVDDNALCIYTMANGVVGTMTASWTYYGQEDNSTVIYGTRGNMRIYDTGHSIEMNIIGGERTMMDVEQIQTNDNQTKSGIIDLFIDTLEGRVENQISGHSVLPAMRAVFAAIKSSEEGRTVVIPENK